MEWKDALLDIVKDSGSRLRFGEPLGKAYLLRHRW